MAPIRRTCITSPTIAAGNGGLSPGTGCARAPSRNGSPRRRPSRSSSGVSETAPLLRMEGIVKTFPGVRALDGVTFEVERGEGYALVGENGAGKSTLMKILAGAERADAGTIAVDGRPVTIDGPRAAEDLGIGMIYQEFNLVPELGVVENILLGHDPTVRRIFLDRSAA